MRFFRDWILSAATAGSVAVAIGGVGSVFWGVVAGALALLVQQADKSRFAPPRP